MNWQFWIDVGGTFTDCLAVRPDGTIERRKVLSSGVLRGIVEETADAMTILVPAAFAGAEHLYTGYRVRPLAGGEPATVVHSADRRWRLDRAVSGLGNGMAFETFSGEEAPVVAIRQFLQLPLAAEIGPVSVRLGTTRGTNALLERKGAAVAFVVTRGFGDCLRIGSQNRPRLFDLHIRKPAELYRTVVELPERLAADGRVLQPLDAAEVRRRLAPLRDQGIEALAVCLLHSYRNPQHENVVAEVAAEMGFAHVALSTRLAPLQRFVPRAQTTVVDAYLTPIIRSYVRNLRRSLPTADLKLMTSAGSLVDADRFVGKDSVLSGPAGGAIGSGRIAQEAGFASAIGFDMGGTSTDVTRFDGAVERRYEMDVVDPTTGGTLKIVAPMLAIETVAAGGGSVCGFDGQRIVVGPESGGSHPGPACYGRGGPLCITDVNLFLGRILPEHFPFPLDAHAVERRLREIQDRVLQATGTRPALEELAVGFVAVANANMAAAIKRVSVAKGYDVRRYALVSFGGAGAQHACAVANELGIRTILQHPYASLLSAFGIGVADVVRFAAKDLGLRLTSEVHAELEPLWQNSESDLRKQVAAEGVHEDRIALGIRRLDLRYFGQDATIPVEEPANRDYATAFEAAHRRLYGFAYPGREIEIRALRLEVVGRTEKPATVKHAASSYSPEPHGRRRAYFGGWIDAPTFVREELRPGARIVGPAVVVEPNSSIVVEAGWIAEVSERDDLVLTAGEMHREVHAQIVERADPVLLELFNNRFASIAAQMGETLRRTALSTNVKERLDYSCAVFDKDGSLVVNAPHIPVHLGAMSQTVRSLLAEFPDLKSGDVLVTNDPFRGGSHLPDVTVVTPVFGADGGLLFFTGSRAHHAEIGGVTPGSMPPFSKNLAEEGVLLRAFRVASGGVFHEAELRARLTSGPYPTRAVEDNVADLGAQIAANAAGADLLRELVDREGAGLVLAYMKFIREAAATKVAQAIRKLPAGTRRFADALDDGSEIAVTLEIVHDAAGGQARLDFTGTGPTSQGNQNANPAIVRSAVLYAFRCLLAEDIPLNDGVLDPVEIFIPHGTLLNPTANDDPAKCPAVVGGNVETSQRVVDVVLGALEAAAASQGTMNNFLFGRPADGARSGFGYYETIAGGAGAGPGFAGSSAVHTHMTNTRITDPEVLEDRYPVRLQEFSIRRGSGGAGKFAGGDGVVREVEFLEPLVVSLLTNRRSRPPFGLRGGVAGKPGRNLLIRAGKPAEELPSAIRFDAAPGDRLRIETPGGGGFMPFE